MYNFTTPEIKLEQLKTPVDITPLVFKDSTIGVMDSIGRVNIRYLYGTYVLPDGGSAEVEGLEEYPLSTWLELGAIKDFRTRYGHTFAMDPCMTVEYTSGDSELAYGTYLIPELLLLYAKWSGTTEYLETKLHVEKIGVVNTVILDYPPQLKTS